MELAPLVALLDEVESGRRAFRLNAEDATDPYAGCQLHVDLIRACYDSGLMDKVDPWGPEVEALAQATQQELVDRVSEIPTAVLIGLVARFVRGDRFNAGLLAAAAESGLLSVLVRECSLRPED